MASLLSFKANHLTQRNQFVQKFSLKIATLFFKICFNQFSLNGPGYYLSYFYYPDNYTEKLTTLRVESNFNDTSGLSINYNNKIHLFEIYN